MASDVGYYGANFIADLLFGGSNPIPISYFLALCTAEPNPTLNGSQIQEPPSAAAYTRISVPNDKTHFGTAGGGVVANITTLAWPIATADWGIVSSYALLDAATGGNMYLYGTFQLPRLVANGHLARFDPGLITFSVSGVQQTLIPSV